MFTLKDFMNNTIVLDSVSSNIKMSKDKKEDSYYFSYKDELIARLWKVDDFWTVYWYDIHASQIVESLTNGLYVIEKHVRRRLA